MFMCAMGTIGALITTAELSELPLKLYLEVGIFSPLYFPLAIFISLHSYITNSPNGPPENEMSTFWWIVVAISRFFLILWNIFQGAVVADKIPFEENHTVVYEFVSKVF